MKTSGKYLLQGKNSTLRFQVLVNPATPEPDVYCIVFADFEPVELHRLPAEQTLEFFQRVIDRLAELREELNADHPKNTSSGSWMARHERYCRYLGTWAEIYGESFANCEAEIMRNVVIRGLFRLVDKPDCKPKIKLQALELLTRICGVGQEHETAR